MTLLIFITNALEVVLFLSLAIFILSSYYLILVVKKSNYDLIQKSVTNPVFPNIDLGFFKKLQKEYMLVRTNIFPAIANKVSFYVLIVGFILLMLIVIFQEAVRY